MVAPWRKRRAPGRAGRACRHLAFGSNGSAPERGLTALTDSLAALTLVLKVEDHARADSTDESQGCPRQRLRTSDGHHRAGVSNLASRGAGRRTSLPLRHPAVPYMPGLTPRLDVCLMLAASAPEPAAEDAEPPAPASPAFALAASASAGAAFAAGLAGAGLAGPPLAGPSASPRLAPAEAPGLAAARADVKAALGDREATRMAAHAALMVEGGKSAGSRAAAGSVWVRLWRGGGLRVRPPAAHMTRARTTLDLPVPSMPTSLADASL